MRLHVYEAAAHSIIEQADYYQEKAGPALALTWEAAIDESIRSILRWPEIGSPCRFRAPTLAGLRWTSVEGFPKHMIFYRYVQAEQAILVVQILHGARDIKSLFGDDEGTK